MGVSQNLGGRSKNAIFFERPKRSPMVFCKRVQQILEMAGWFDPHAHVLPSNRHRQTSQLSGLVRFQGAML